MVVMPTPLKDDDYLLEIKVRVAVRNIDATTVIAAGPKWPKDKTEEAKLLSALYDLISKGMTKRGEAVQPAHYAATRFDSVREFHSFVDETFARFQNRGEVEQAGPQLVPPQEPGE
jgi:hypothetical protein